ncbi:MULTISPECIES: hypothetical protein [unclassified Paraburkholderia]|uniref:hypothetical protein n=1 Tax=unclassified Paraburkholderia TaxID=2615204 RepID=UPI002AAF0C9D|nr:MULTISPECIES: hypothetical protein [unclassified Paraburkholderia]
MQQRTAATCISRLRVAAHETTFGHLMPHAHLAQHNPPIERYEQLMRKELRNGLSLQDTAAALATDPSLVAAALSQCAG